MSLISHGASVAAVLRRAVLREMVRRLPEMPMIFMLLLLISTPPRAFMQPGVPRFGRSGCKTTDLPDLFPKEFHETPRGLLS
jgi:hypothetical protein